MPKLPVVSIVLPVWNGEKYLEQALQSVLNQTYKNFELIIVNDCSSDSSLEIANKYAQSDKRIRILSNSLNLKLPKSLNVGFEAAVGKYYTWTSDDNLLHPTFLEEMLHDLQAIKADIIYADFNSIDESGSIIGVSPVGSAEDLVIANSIGAAFLYRKEVHISLNGFDVDCFLYEDYDFWVRSYLNGFIFSKSKKVLYDYRRHEQSLTSSQVIPEKFAFYRYRLRKVFPNVSRKNAFEARKVLMGYRHTLGIKKWFLLMGESFFINPIKTIQIICNLATKIPAKLNSSFFQNKSS